MTRRHRRLLIPVFALLLTLPALAGCGLLGGNPAETRAREFFAALRSGEGNRAQAMYRQSADSTRPEARARADILAAASSLGRTQIRDERTVQSRVKRASEADRAARRGDAYIIGLEYQYRLSNEAWRPGIFLVTVQELDGGYYVVDWQS